MRELRTLDSPTWFYSSLAQVTAALVGLVGGFLFLRLQRRMTYLVELLDRLRSAQVAWREAAHVVREHARRHGEVEPALEVEETRARRELVTAVRAARASEYPAKQVRLPAFLLLILLFVGAGLPLLALDEPDLGEKMLYLVPAIAIVLLFLVVVNVEPRRRKRAIDRYLRNDIPPDVQSLVDEWEREEAIGSRRAPSSVSRT